MFSKFILSCLVACTAAFPHISLVNQGPQTGPLTPAYGDLVQTPRGLASIALEGFSEDLNQDGYVDPVGQATVPVAVAQPVAAPVTVPHVAPVQYTHAAPVATHAIAPAPAAIATHAVAAAPAAVATHAVAAAPVSVAAAPSLTSGYATPVAAAPHSHTIAATPAVAYPAAHAVQAVAPAATVPIAAAAAPVAAVHAQAHGACVNNFGAVV